MPLLYVPGNHDPSVRQPDSTWMPLQAEVPEPGPAGCECIDGRLVDVGGLRFAGFGGSLRYRPGPNQYTPAQMRLRAGVVELRLRFKRFRHGRKLDVLVTHAAPSGVDASPDAVHQGFAAFSRLIREFRPLLAIHGHVHPYGRTLPEHRAGPTRIINAVPSRIIEL